MWVVGEVLEAVIELDDGHSEGIVGVRQVAKGTVDGGEGFVIVTGWDDGEDYFLL